MDGWFSTFRPSPTRTAVAGMTIKVKIENQDKKCTVEILERTFDRRSCKKKETFIRKIAPNCSTIVYVYLLKDVVIREQEPT